MNSLPERSAALLLLASLLALSGAVVFVDDRAVRLILALVTASAALWAAMSVAAAGTRRRVSPEGVERRRFLALRARTDEFLRHIRAMNLVALQARSGVRPATEAEEQLNGIEQRLHVLIPEFRRAAGRTA